MHYINYFLSGYYFQNFDNEVLIEQSAVSVALGLVFIQLHQYVLSVVNQLSH